MPPPFEPPSPAPGEAAPGRWARWPDALPWLVILAGGAFAAWLLGLTRPGIFYSGDGGLKALVVEQFARGDLRPDLRLPAPPWAQELWNAGYFPFDFPFTYVVGDRIFAWCPLPFELLTAPAYAAFGWRGLYLLPVLGLLGLWIALWRFGRALALGPAWTALALFAVIFCSPITIYGAVFWEHTLAVALATGGLTLAVAPALRSQTWNGVLAGLLVGLSVWFRSEMFWLCVVVAALLPVARFLGIDLRARRATFGGLALAGIGFLAWNAVIYGNPLGLATRPLTAEAGFGSRLQGVAWIGPSLASALAARGGAIFLALAGALALRLLRADDLDARRAVRPWALLAVAFAVGLPLTLPNYMGGDGGKQFGPRYLLAVFPMAAVVLAVSARALWRRAGIPTRVALVAALAAGLGAGVRTNALDGAGDLAGDYAYRVEPTILAARADPAEALVVTNPLMSLELTSLAGPKQLFRVRNPTDLQRLAAGLARAGQPRFLVVGDVGPMRLDLPVATTTGPAVLRVQPIGCYGWLMWCLHDARVLPP